MIDEIISRHGHDCMTVYISRALMYLEESELWIHFINGVGVHSPLCMTWLVATDGIA